MAEERVIRVEHTEFVVRPQTRHLRWEEERRVRTIAAKAASVAHRSLKVSLSAATHLAE